jgi:hypothetical protein
MMPTETGTSAKPRTQPHHARHRLRIGQRHQPFCRAWHQLQQVGQVAQVGSYQPDVRHRIAAPGARQAHDHKILGQHDLVGPRPNLGAFRRHPGHPRQRVAGIHGQRRPPPAQPIACVDPRVDRGSLGGASPVLPDHRRGKHRARRIDEDMRVDLRGDPHRPHLPRQPLLLQARQNLIHAGQPVIG